MPALMEAAWPKRHRWVIKSSSARSFSLLLCVSFIISAPGFLGLCRKSPARLWNAAYGDNLSRP